MKRTFTHGIGLAVFVFIISFLCVFTVKAATKSVPSPVSTRPPVTPWSNVCSNTDINVKVLLANNNPAQTLAGGSVNISGAIVNVNSYPIPDLSMSVRLVHLAKNFGSSYDTIIDTVGWSTALSGSYVSANSSANFSITVPIPSGLVSGPYLIEIFLNGSKQFAVGGNEYMGVPAATSPLTVSSSQKQTSYFDLSSLKVNGMAPNKQFVRTPYGVGSATSSVEFISSIYGTQTATTSIAIAIANTHSVSSTATVKWNLFKGDFVDVAKIVDTKTDSVALLPGKNTTVSFSSSAVIGSRYTLVGELQDGSKKSFFSVHLYRPNVNELMPLSLRLDSVPSASGAGSISGCLVRSSYATTTPVAALSLTDANGSTIWSSSLPIKSRLLISSFHLPIDSSSDLVGPLTLSLKTTDASGKVTSFASVKYPYEALSRPIWSNVWFFVIVALVCIVLIILIAYLKKSNKAKSLTSPTQ